MEMLEIPVQVGIKRKKSESPFEIKSPQEEVLASREKISSSKIGRGVTDSSFVEFRDDGKGIFKTELYNNERAAYLIDRFLGINLTPPTTIRTLDGETGSIQEFIPNAEIFEEIKFQKKSDYDEFMEKHKEEFMKMWVFDLIIGNFDRNISNFLFSDGRLYAIDHGHSLTHNYEDNFLKRITTHNGFESFLVKNCP